MPVECDNVEADCCAEQGHICYGKKQCQATSHICPEAYARQVTAAAAAAAAQRAAQKAAALLTGRQTAA
jgi:hypothetical protein